MDEIAKRYKVDRMDIIYAMQRYGGSFVQALALAWMKADLVNDAKLRAAFPEYYEQYADMARNMKEAARNE